MSGRLARLSLFARLLVAVALIGAMALGVLRSVTDPGTRQVRQLSARQVAQAAPLAADNADNADNGSDDNSGDDNSSDDNSGDDNSSDDNGGDDNNACASVPRATDTLARAHLKLARTTSRSGPSLGWSLASLLAAPLAQDNSDNADNGGDDNGGDDNADNSDNEDNGGDDNADNGDNAGDECDNDGGDNGGAPATATPVATATPRPTQPTQPSQPQEGGTATCPAPGPGPAVVRDARYFAATGYRIDNDVINNYFDRRGRERTFGLPVSRTVMFLGFQSQFFQGLIVQVSPTGVAFTRGYDEMAEIYLSALAQTGSARTMNLLDPGLMPVDQINFSSFPPFDRNLATSAPIPSQPNYGQAVIDFVRANAPETFNGQPVRFFSTFENTVRLEDAFPGGGGNPGLLPLLNLEIWGIPTSAPRVDPNNANFIYQRYQRGIMHFDGTQRITQRILLADWFKSVITGNNLPPDLDAQMQGSNYYRQYNPCRPLWINRPSQLPATDLTWAFQPG